MSNGKQSGPRIGMEKGPLTGIGFRLVPVANRRAPRVAQCPHERRSGARGRCLFAHRGKPGWHSGAVFEAPALVAGFDDFAMMGQAIEERGRHLGVAKHTGPIAKGQIGGDDDGSALVKPADQMKEQLAASLSEGQVAELVENDEVHAREIFGEPPLPAGAGFALQPVDEVDDGVEAPPGAAADAGPRNSYGQMRLAGAGAADQHGVALLGQKVPLARSRTSVWLIGVPVKSKSSMSLASGNLAMVSWY